MAESPELIALARSAAAAAGVPEDLFLGLVRTESNWNPSARSAVGALGLAQVMPIWASPSYAAAIGMTGITVSDLLDPATNLTAGARILAQELSRFGRPELAAMAYNAGAPAVMAAVRAAGTNEPQAVSDKLRAAETRAYWQKVTNWAEYYANKTAEWTAAAENVATDTAETIKDVTGGAVSPWLLVGVVVLGAIVWAVRR